MRLLLCAVLTVMALPVMAMADGDDVVDQWVTEDAKSRIEIFQERGKYAGKIVWLKDPVYEEGDPEEGVIVHDRENPDKNKRDRPILGLRMLEGFEYAGKNLWKKGTIYDPENGKTYKCKMTLEDRNTLRVRGFIGVSMIGRTTVWKRYEKPEEKEKKAEAKE